MTQNVQVSDHTFQDIWLQVCDHPIMVIQIIKTFSVQFFCVFLPLLLPRLGPQCFCLLFFFPSSLLFFPCMKCSLDLSDYLKEISTLSQVLFSSTTLHCSLLPCSQLFSETLHSHGYIFPFLPCLSLVFFPQPFPQNCFAFLHQFFFGMVLVTAKTFGTMLSTTVYSSSGILSTRSNSMHLFVTSTIES